ncbi:MAG TPA: methyltransferase [Puia sp.]|nr:methyltransferase [Puia sp.]
MPNSYFQFKQFTIHQDKSAMKVCTDSCILGAWSIKHLSGTKKILDVGAGTGLLSLMLAQKSESQIDSIELDRESAAQAFENITASSWSARIRLLEGNVLHYPLPSDYDFIISNPPFFESDLRSPVEKKNKAKHNETLTLDELIVVIRNHLKKTGSFSVLLPYHRSGYFENLATTNGFFLWEKLNVRQTPDHQPFRSICLFGFQKPETTNSKELIIKNENGKYTGEFLDLMFDYYG